MKQRLKQDNRLDQTKALHTQLTLQGRQERAGLEDEYESAEGDPGEEADRVEMEDDLEPMGDSEARISEDIFENPFDLEWRGVLPLIRELPQKARPMVLYSIEEYYNVRPLLRRKRRTRQDEVRLLVAEAIARHLRKHEIRIDEELGWTDCPAIPGEDGLKLLVEEGGSSLGVEYKNQRGALKDFGIALPSGEVLVPAAIMTDRRKTAQDRKKASRASALRRASETPARLAGDDWSQEDWKIFERNQQKKQKSRKPRDRRDELE